MSSIHMGCQEIAFQLENNEIVLFDALHHYIFHFVGI